MKTFKQFIAESRWDKYVYHATYRYGFDPKKPPAGVHVGTLHAAMARARYRSEQNDENDLNVHVFKYKPSGKSVRIKDEGSEGMSWDMDVQRQLKKKGIMSRRTAVNSTMRENLPKHTAQTLKKHGISSLSYRNATEDPSSTSRIIYDPERLQHVHTFKNPKFLNRQYGKPIGGEYPEPFFNKSRKERKIK